MAALQRLGAKIPKLISAAQPKLQTFWRYAKVELRPPTPGEFGEVKNGFVNLVSGIRTQKWKTLTVKDATINTLITAEVIFWFFIGECIGKGSLTGYQIPGAVDFEAHI
jgi:F-type H+-transporting ATPase subunit g